MPGITDIGADAAQNSSPSDGGNDNDYDSEWEAHSLQGYDFAKQHPTTAVRGTATVLRYLPDWDNDEPDRGDFAVVLEDPDVFVGEDTLEGTAIFENSEETGDDFKVVNLDDEATEHLEGSGVDFDGNLFYGEPVDGFGVEELALKATGSSGRSVANTLDVKGGTGARSVGSYDGEDVELHGGGFPEHNGGLVEYHPDGRDGERPRIARHTELRPDVEGREVVVMIQRLAEVSEDYDGNAYWATVFANLEDERQTELAQEYADDGEDPEDYIADVDGTEMIRLQPTSDFEPDEDMVRETGYIQWNRVDLDELNDAREAEGFDPYEPQEDTADA